MTTPIETTDDRIEDCLGSRYLTTVCDLIMTAHRKASWWWMPSVRISNSSSHRN